jgi:lysophospholipase L1-like esterase
MMARRSLLLLCTAAALLLSGCASHTAPQEIPSPAETEPAERPLIVCMGDSITAGYGVYTDDEMYSAYLQTLLGDRARVEAYGIPGETLQEAAVYRSSALNAGADKVLLQFGTNDASPSLFRPDAFREAAETLLDTHIDALGADNVAFLLPPCVFPAGGDIASFGMSEEKLAQVREILTQYGDLALIWFDIGFTPTKKQANELYDMVRALQPGCLINSRIGCGKCDYTSSNDNEIPKDDKSGMLYETCATINDSWGYKPTDQGWKSAETIRANREHLKKIGANYLLNVGPDALGRIPARSADVLRAANA